jgi:PD-(D/E)XK nuclease superfamily protein
MMYRGYSEDHHLDNPENPWFRLSYTNLSKIIAEYLETHPLNAFSFSVNPKLVEVGFEVPLIDECVCGHAEERHLDGGCAWRHHCKCAEYRPAFVFWGRLDAIVQSNHDRSLYVLDHKTTGRLSPYTAEKYRMDSQMSGYVWAAQRTIGQPIVGVYINAIEFAKLPSDPVRKCRDHGVVYAECGRYHMKSELLIYTRSPDQLEDWRRTALSLARRYRDLASQVPHIEALPDVMQQGTFNGACGFCDFAKFCQAGRPTHYVQTMLTYSPWQPYEKGETSSGQTT